MIFLQIIATLTNFTWKFFLSKKDAESKYWWFMTIDSFLISLVFFFSQIYILALFEIWSLYMSLASRLKWNGIDNKNLEKYFFCAMCFIFILLYSRQGFNMEFLAVIFFGFAIQLLKVKDRLGWFLLGIGHICMLFPIYEKQIWVTFFSLLVSIVFSVKGFVSWKSTQIFFKKSYVLVYSTSLVRFLGRFVSLGTGAYGITLYPCIFIRKDFKNQGFDSELILHEEIHIAQQRELLVIGAFLLYLYEYLYAKFFLRLSARDAYYYTATEQEAHRNAHKPGYIKNRKPYAVFWYIKFKNKKKLSRDTTGALVVSGEYGAR